MSLAGVLIAVGALCNALGNVLSQTNPEQALRFDPYNPLALGALVTLKSPMASKKSAASRDTIVAQAQRALEQGPILASSMRAVAFASVMQGHSGQSVAQMQIAQTLSRRDLPTQLALIELCVAQGDVRCALSHYDIALSTSNANAAPLFPTLSAALSSANIVRGLVPFIKAHRPWIDDFMAYAVANADPGAAASIVIASKGLPNTPLNQESEAVLLGRLGASGQWDLVRRTYDALEGDGAATAPRIGFSNRTTDAHRVPVAWELTSNSSVSAGFEPNAGGYQLHINVSSGLGGDVPVARRMLFLPPGSAQALTLRINGASLDADSSIGLSLACPAFQDVRPAIWRQAAPKVSTYTWSFTIPAGCPVQQLGLFIGGDANQADGDLIIGQITLRPLFAQMRSR